MAEGDAVTTRVVAADDPRAPLAAPRPRAGAAPGPGPAVGPLDVADPGTLVDRQGELERLRAAWGAAGSGVTRIVLLAGEPGTGKTRLAAETAAFVRENGGLVLAGSCRSGVPRPYEPLVEALAPLVATCPEAALGAHADRHGPALAWLLPDAARRLGGRPAGDRPGPRPRFLDALAAAVTELATGPVLLVLDDLHRATASIVDVLDRLVRRSRTAPLLVIGAYRDAAVHPGHPLGRFLGDPPAARTDRLVLANLPPHAVGSLVADRAAVAGTDDAAALAAALWRATDGNPLLLTEVVRDLVADGTLNAGRPPDPDRLRLPRTVAEVVNRRLGPPGSRRRGVVEVAATVGVEFPTRLVSQLLGGRRDLVEQAVAAAHRAAVVRPVAGRPGWYRFVHDAVHAALYETVPSGRRVLLHRRIAETLERANEGPGDPADLLRHRAAATPVGRSPQAVDGATAVGRSAVEVLAFEEAAEAFGMALAFLGPTAGAGARIDLLLHLAEAHARGGDSSRARQSYLMASALARATEDGPRLGRAVLGLGDVVGVWGTDAALIDLLEEALATNPHESGLVARLQARLAQARVAADSPDVRRHRADRARELALDSRDPDVMGAVLRARHEALPAPDDLVDRLEVDEELLAMAASSRDPELSLLAHGWRLVDRLEQGRMGEADRDRRDHAVLARRSQEPRHRGDAARWAAAWAIAAGDWRRAATEADRALELGKESGDPLAASHYWVQQAGLVLDQGDPAELAGLVEVWRELVRAHDAEPLWPAMLALLLAQAGRAAEARSLLADLLDSDLADLPLDREWLATVATAGEAAARVGHERAEAVARLLVPYGRRLVVVGPGLLCRGSVSHVTGLLHGATGHWAEAEAELRSALSVHERLGLEPMAVRTRAELGRCLASRPGPGLHTERARVLLAEAAADAAGLGMAGVAADASAALDVLS